MTEQELGSEQESIMRKKRQALEDAVEDALDAGLAPADVKETASDAVYNWLDEHGIRPRSDD